jgi:hypothetical protein
MPLNAAKCCKNAGKFFPDSPDPQTGYKIKETRYTKAVDDNYNNLKKLRSYKILTGG